MIEMLQTKSIIAVILIVLGVTYISAVQTNDLEGNTKTYNMSEYNI